jgi:hypothetical protein
MYRVMYRVVAIGKWGTRNVVAVFPSRERAERYVAKVKELDPEAVLEIEEVKYYRPVIAGVAVGVGLILLMTKLLRD